MKRRNRRYGKAGKERVVMFAASVFVLGALTLTGVYVKESNTKQNDDGYSIDLSSLEKKNDTTKNQADVALEETDKPISVQNPDASYELDFEVVLEEGELDKDDLAARVEGESNEKETAQDATNDTAKEDAQKIDENEKEDDGESTSASTTTWQALQFQEEDGLVWPTVGDILINYSMDQTVYFPTLAQYKYNPAIIISAAEGKTIVAAADAQVLEIFEDDEIGTAVKMDLGSGYELVYGQLSDVQVSKGSYVKAGDVVGTVGAPTKYYSVEGSNLYVKVTKDGTPINPLSLLQ